MRRRGRRGKKGRAFQMLTNCKNLPLDVKSISPSIIQGHAYSHMHTWMHTHTHACIHQPPRRAIFCVHLKRQPRSCPTSNRVFQFPRKSSLSAASRFQPAWLPVRFAVSRGKMGTRNSRQEPASTAGTANPFSREITRALVKSQRRSMGRFQLPQEMKRWRGGGTRWWKRETKRVKSLSERWPSPTMWPIPLAAYQNRGWVNGVC